MSGLTLRIDFAKMESVLQLVADNAAAQTHRQVKRSVNTQQRLKHATLKLLST
jgi:hypothetical protein